MPGGSRPAAGRGRSRWRARRPAAEQQQRQATAPATVSRPHHGDSSPMYFRSSSTYTRTAFRAGASSATPGASSRRAAARPSPAASARPSPPRLASRPADPVRYSRVRADQVGRARRDARRGPGRPPGRCSASTVSSTARQLARSSHPPPCSRRPPPGRPRRRALAPPGSQTSRSPGEWPAPGMADDDASCPRAAACRHVVTGRSGVSANSNPRIASRPTTRTQSAISASSPPSEASTRLSGWAITRAPAFRSTTAPK